MSADFVIHAVPSRNLSQFIENLTQLDLDCSRLGLHHGRLYERNNGVQKKGHRNQGEQYFRCSVGRRWLFGYCQINQFEDLLSALDTPEIVDSTFEFRPISSPKPENYT